MDEDRLRNQICLTAHQMWVRGLIAGDAGIISTELHRRRYLVTPMHARRADLQPDQIICVDVGGLNIQGGSGLNDTHWHPHRAAYQATLRMPAPGEPASAGGHSTSDRNRPAHRRSISATILAHPPIVLALMRLAREDATDLTLPGLPPIPIVAGDDEQALSDALAVGPGVALRSTGLLAAGPDLPSALNWIEKVEHAARIELACPTPAPRSVTPAS